MPRWNKGFEYRSRVGVEGANCRVLDYLVRRYPAGTAEEWMDRIAAGRVLLDGLPTLPNRRLKPGQELAWRRPPWQEPDVPRSFAVLFRDAHILAVAKPSGLPTLPGGGEFMDNTLLALVRRRYPEAAPLHRLGRGTSGIVLFGRTPESTRALFRSWSERKVLKSYRALVTGHPVRDAFRIDVPIGRVAHEVLKTVWAASPDGKASSSLVEVLERRDACSLVRVRIETGRPHQIRIHLAAAGHPLEGDPMYVSGGVPAPGCRARPADLGYSLHNTRLGFPHPGTGAWTEITCAPPPILRRQSESP